MRMHSYVVWLNFRRIHEILLLQALPWWQGGEKCNLAPCSLNEGSEADGGYFLVKRLPRHQDERRGLRVAFIFNDSVSPARWGTHNSRNLLSLQTASDAAVLPGMRGGTRHCPTMKNFATGLG